MKYTSFVTIALAAMALMALAETGAAQAGERRAAVTQDSGKLVKKGKKSSARVYGYSARRGGYSYSPSDVMNTYGLTRNTYGSNNSFRDPWADRQTNNGPFDHGFFFDSITAPRGGDSPYLH